MIYKNPLNIKSSKTFSFPPPPLPQSLNPELFSLEAGVGALGNLREMISFSSYLKVFLTDFTTSILFFDNPTAAQVDQRLCPSPDTSGFFPDLTILYIFSNLDRALGV